ncbi:probable G-protein coupled receptor CG31760 [Acanthaster planci]|uniref:Probable G-protein coupled receptor CG31760 n=1 Tax=Acanthaster planci TaxID=133434 RepID=A0A8B7ZJH3_ACAPL|nr:probable G-protein coupled receptor CG31760 [Acanthaster planci]
MERFQRRHEFSELDVGKYLGPSCVVLWMDVKMTACSSPRQRLRVAILCLQIVTVVRSRERPDMSGVTEALEYVQEIASQGEGNCSFGPTLNLEYDQDRWSEQAAVAVHSANLLTSLSRTGDHIFGAGEEDEQLPYSIVRANVDNYPNVFGSAIAFDYLLYRDYEVFSPYAFQAADGTEVKDLSIGYDYRTNSTDWFYIPFQNFKDESLDSNYTFHGSLSSNATSMARLTLGDGYWTKPYFDCGGGNVWMVTFSMPFFLPARRDSANVSSDISSQRLTFAGVTTIDIALSSLDINQCPKNDSNSDDQTVFDPFVDTHLCKDTTYCSPISGLGFERGAYKCICRKGYYFPDTSNPHQAFNGTEIEAEYSKKVHGYENTYDSDFNCLKCMKECDECVDATPCFLEPSAVLSTVVLALTGACVLVLLVLIIYTWVNRDNKVFKAASPGLLYVFLIGSAVMYTENILHAAFRGTDMGSWHCLLQPWARYLGVGLAYGALLFKTWRITVVFTVRSAKPVRITDAQLYLRIGALIILMALFLGVGTYLQPSVEETQVTSNNLKYRQCTVTLWSYIGEGATLVLLAWGVYLCIKVRKAPSAFNESKFISICIYNETIISAFNIILTTVVLESVEQSVADKHLFVGVCRVQLTVTIMVTLLYGSKIYHVMQNRQQKTGTPLELRKRGKGARGPTGTSGLATLDSISPTIDFCYSNPDVKSEFERMVKVLESIKEAMQLHDDGLMQTCLSDFEKELWVARAQDRPTSTLVGGEDDTPGPSHVATFPGRHRPSRTPSIENWVLK